MDRNTGRCSYTAHGQPIDYLQPGRTTLLGRDLCQHLSAMPRYAGAIPVSVLEHLVICTRIARARGYPPIAVAYVAAHDMHEGYVHDIPTAMKRALPQYGSLIEEPWERHVHFQAGLQWPPPDRVVPAVKVIDLDALVAEMLYHGHPARTLAMERHSRGAELDHIEIVGQVCETMDASTCWDEVNEAISEYTGRSIPW